jgi:hypothetical protein
LTSVVSNSEALRSSLVVGENRELCTAGAKEGDELKIRVLWVDTFVGNEILNIP